MMDSRELAMLRKQTERFINERPVNITLKRDVRVDDGAGGYTTEPGQPISKQTFRMVPQDQMMVNNQTVDSTEIHPQYILIGLFDADVQYGDKFTIDDHDYSIEWVKHRDEQSYETWAEARDHG